MPSLKMTGRASNVWLLGLSAVLAIGLTTVVLSMAQEDGQAPNADGKTKKTPVDEDGKAIENPFPNRFPAPNFDGGVGWLNTSGEITLRDLRGKVVLLDFWTYCCINCMHVLPDLKFLEKKYPNELVVIGVHSAKFDNEKDSEAIRRAIVRYEIEHPVINDAEMLVWRKFGARAWPTLVVIDPEGQYCGYISGEGHREILDQVVGRLIAYHKAKGTLDTSPVRFDLERSRVQPTPLKFPGKIIADPAGKRLFISDSNHNRIVVTTLDGKLLEVIGTGQIGRKDGGYSQASFDHPQGLTLHSGILYVADTENHLIRTVDLQSKTVATLVGTGVQDRARGSGGDLKSTPLNSPWDLTVVGDTLYVAMAGPHQIWSHKLGSQEIGVFAGSGREDIINGSLEESAFAQPSGLSSDGKYLYVADSEGSAIRKVPLAGDEDVFTVVGEHDLPGGRTLFEFGDTDAVGSKARLQHPLGVVYHQGQLFVADAYNHKIKRVDPKTRESKTLLGSGKMGDGVDPIELHEPAGMAAVGNTLYVADTNNHRILAVDLKSDKLVGRVLEIDGLTPPQRSTVTEDLAVGDQKPTALPVQTVAPGKTLQMQVRFKLPEGYKLNPDFPLRAKFNADEGQSLIAAENLGKSVAGKIADDAAVFELPLAAETGKANLLVSVSFSYCRGGESGLCKLHTTRWSLPLEVKEGGAARLELVSATAD